MKKSKLLLSLTATISASSLLAPIATLTTSCSTKVETSQFALLKTSKGYCIDSLTVEDRSTITDLVVPESIDGTPVVEISKGAFKGCTSLQSITLPFIGHTADAIGTAGLFGYIFGDEMYEGCGAYTWQCFSTSDEYDDEPDEFAQFAIPVTLRNVTITSASNISAGAFSNCKYLKSITFNQTSNSTTATEIGNFAFYGCTALKTFTIPSTIKTIGRQSFKDCHSLRTIEIPSGVTTIKHNAFSNCVSAYKASIPASVTTMGKLTFENFTSGLIMVEAEEAPSGWDSSWITHDISVVYGFGSESSVYYTDEVQVAICGSGENKYAFVISWLGDWESETITIPGEVSCGGTTYPIKKVGPNVFYENTYVKTINIGENIETLGTSCFEGCTNLTTVNFPDSLHTIGTNCFYNSPVHMHTEEANGDVEGIYFNKVKTIGANAFEGNESLKKISFAETDGIETIGESAFKDCLNLAPLRDNGSSAKTNAIVFPKTIKAIEAYAFYNIGKYRDSTTQQNIGDIVFTAGNENEVTIGESAFENAGVRSTTTEYPLTILFYIDFNNINIKKFENNSFKNVYLYEILNFPQSLEEIGDYAFYNSIPVYFSTTHDLDHRKLTIPASVTKIGAYAFYNCYNCSFEFQDTTNNPSQLKEIGKHSFRYCSYNPATVGKGFNYLVIPNSVETIGEYAFQGDGGIRTIKLPENDKFTRIENYTFSSCTNLGVEQTDDAPNPVIVPETVTYIGSNAFSSCKYLKYLTVKGEITYLGSSVFAGCESIENGKETSNGNLKSLVFEDEFEHLTTFGSNMYQGCKKLVWAPFPEEGKSSITSIPSTCFADCDVLTNFNILSNITSIGEAAFRNCKTMSSVTGMGAVKVISKNTFSGCSSLSSFDMPQACYSIGDNAFAYCTSLTTLTLPTDITQAWTSETSKGMGNTPFIGWTATQTIKFNEANIESTEESTGKITLRWGWVLTPDNVSTPTYYTCADSGSSVVHFVKATA